MRRHIRTFGQQRGGGANEWALSPAINAYIDKDGKKYRCEVALPGVDPKDITVEVQGNVL